MNNKINNILNNNNKKYIIIIPILILIIIIISINNILNNYNSKTDKELLTSISNKENILIYNYNSKNKLDREIKSYLDKLNIKYYKYNMNTINKRQYNKLLKIIKIDKKIYGTPAIIYLKYGSMYANIINIDDIKTVKDFMNTYIIKKKNKN